MNPEKSFFTNLIETTKEIINTFSSELKEAKKSVTKEIANNNLKTPDIVSGKENKNNQEKTENEAVIKSRQETAQLFVETTEQLQYNAIFAEYLQKTLDPEDIKKIMEVFPGKSSEGSPIEKLAKSITEFHKQKNNAILAAHPIKENTTPDSGKLDAFNLIMLFSFSADVKEAFEKFFTISSHMNKEFIQKEYTIPTKEKIEKNRKTRRTKNRKDYSSLQSNEYDFTDPKNANGKENIIIQENDLSYNNIMNLARQYDGLPYRRGGVSKTKGVDCSGLWSAVLGQIVGKRKFPRLTAEGFRSRSKLTASNEDQVEKKINGVKQGTFMYRNKGRSFGKTYHIEMVINKPYQENSIWFVDTYGSSIDGINGVRVRKRKIESKHTFGNLNY